MSSLSRGATGAGKPKPLNVNSIYAGRNLAAGARPLGKHGLQSVGKSVGVVRRMPPPATLPSLKAENNGQDPTIAVVPQGGTGWNKGESSTAVAIETPKTSVSASALVSNGPDLRPTWAKPSMEPSSVSTGASNREFPSLAVAAQGKDALLKPQNKWATGSLTQNSDSRLNVQSANNLDEERQLPSRYYDSGNQQSSRLVQTQQRSRFQGSSDARMSQPNYYVNATSSNGRKFSENERLDDQSDSHDELFPTKDVFSEKSDGHHISEGFFDGSHSQEQENFPQPLCNTSHENEVNSYGEHRGSDLDRDMNNDRSRQKRNNYRNGQSSDDLTHWDEQERPSSRDSYGQRSHNTYQHHSHQNGSDHRGVATQRRWGQPQQSVLSNQHPQHQHQKRGSYHREELLAPLPHSIPVPEYRLLKRPEKKLELEDVSDDEEDIQMTKLNKPAVRVVKRVAVGENNQDTEGNTEEKNREEVTLKKEKGSKSPAICLSRITSTSRPNCDQLMFKKTDRSKPCEVPVPKQVEQESVSEQKNYEDVQPAPPPAENVWAKRQEERESQERDKHSHMPKAMQQAIEQHFPSVAEAASIKVDKEAARRPADVEFTRATLRARRQQGSNDVRQVMSRDENYAEKRAQLREQREQRYDYHTRDRHQQKSVKEYREQRECVGDQTDSWDQQQRYNSNVGNQRRYYYQDRRDHQTETSGDCDREQQYNGGPREYVNIRVMSGRRGVPIRGRGSRGGYSRGHDRSGYLIHHPQILRRPFMDRSEQSEQEKFTEKEEQNDSFSNMGEFDANEISKNITSPQVSVGKISSPAIENTERSISVESDDKSIIATRFKDMKDEKAPGDDASQGERVFQKGVDRQQFSRGRWNVRGSMTATRGRGEIRRGRGGYYSHSRDGQLHELRGPRRHRVLEDDESEEAGQPVNNASRQGRGSYSQQRTRRGQNKEQKHRNHQHCRALEDRLSNPNQERADRLKSPVVSSEGHDEWETASESSGRARKEEKETVAASRRSTPYRLTAGYQQIRRGNNASHAQNGTGTEEPGIKTDRVRSKNGQPASRTCRSPSENDNRTREHQQRQRHHSVERIGASDGLAGLDINNIASVVVIDEHLQDSVSGDAIDEFEEVLNKRAKKQKALEQQQKLEAEERRKQKEKERSERLQARKIARQTVKKETKKLEEARRKETNSLDTNDNNERKKIMETKKDEKDIKKFTASATGHPERKEIPLTTVWNSAHIAEKELLKDQDVVRVPSVIPSPIARPTPRSKSAASDTSPNCKKEVPLREHMVELPVSLSASQPLRAEKYDFTFDPDLHEVQVRESSDKANIALSTGANSEAGSVAEDYRLKEKLNRVKDLWSGEEKESDSPLPSNVAKVKPQPQSGCEQSSSDGKVEQAMSNSCQPIPPRSPGIAPFPAALGGLSMFPQYPMILSDMVNPGYVTSAHAPPLLPPVNATSPPTGHGTTCPGHYGPPHGGPRAQQRPNYIDQNNTIFINRHQNMTWAPNAAGPLDGVGLMGFGSTPPPQPSTQQKSSQAQTPSNFTFGAPPRGPPVQQQRNYGVAPVQKMVAPPLLPVSFPPPDMMNLPPPSLGAVGSQRADRQFSQGFSSGGSTFAPHPPPHNFNQPPPNMRFAQPPPSIGQDVPWTKSVPPPQFGMLPGPGQLNLSRVGQQQADVWSLNNHAIGGLHQHRTIGMSNVNMSHKSDRLQQQLDRRGPSDEASGMKQPPSGKQPSSCPTTA